LSLSGWRHGCPPGSAAALGRRDPSVLDGRYPNFTPSRKSFVQDHTKLFDLCEYPEQIDLHGLLIINPAPFDAHIKPIWTLSKTSLHTDILAVPVEQWVERVEWHPWEEKNQTRLLWRGTNTGMWYSDEKDWKDSHRIRLMKAFGSKAEAESENIRPPIQSGNRKMTLKEAYDKQPINDLATKILDISFTNKPLRECWSSGRTGIGSHVE
jgi:hypothetical protein